MKKPSVSHPYIIGISGASASGKTHFIRQLRQSFLPGEICLISQDNYYRSKQEQERDNQGYINFDNPAGIDFGKLLSDLDQLKQGKEVYKDEYRFQVEGEESRQIVLHPAPVIIIEGLFIFFVEEVAAQLDLRMVIDADPVIRLERRIIRDTTERGIPHDFVIYQWENHVFPAYEKYLMPFISQADLVILNNNGFDKSLDILTCYLKELLK